LLSQGTEATDLRGGDSFNSNFSRRYFLNLTVKNYEIWSNFTDVIAKVKVTHFLIDGVFCI